MRGFEGITADDVAYHIHICSKNHTTSVIIWAHFNGFIHYSSALFFLRSQLFITFQCSSRASSFDDVHQIIKYGKLFEKLRIKSVLFPRLAYISHQSAEVNNNKISAVITSQHRKKDANKQEQSPFFTFFISIIEFIDNHSSILCVNAALVMCN